MRSGSWEVRIGTWELERGTELLWFRAGRGGKVVKVSSSPTRDSCVGQTPPPHLTLGENVKKTRLDRQ